MKNIKIKSCVEYKIVIKPDCIEEKSAGGIFLAESYTEQESWSQTTGILVAVGGNAFEDWKGDVPQEGERVMFRKFAGDAFTGEDGDTYRVCFDKDISLVIGEEDE